MATELRPVYPSLAALEADHRDNLRKGRAFVVGASGPNEREPCLVSLVHPITGASLSLEAEVVWVKREAPGAGVGVQFLGGEALRERLRVFVEAAPPAATPESEPAEAAPEPPGDPSPDEPEAPDGRPGRATCTSASAA